MKPDKIIKPDGEAKTKTQVFSQQTLHIGPIPSADELAK
jgi:hypothetical protein